MYPFRQTIGVIVVSLMVLVSFSPIRANDALPEPVGSFGDPAHLIFKGESPFTDLELHRAIESDLQIQVAASPSCKLADYLLVLKNRLEQGFRRQGYCRPTITVNDDATTNNLIITLDPGQRWTCGKVVVNGASTISADGLVKRFIDPPLPPPFDSTISEDEITITNQPNMSIADENEWVPGDPAPFDEFSIDELTRFARTQLATMGYFHPFLKVSIEPGPKDASLIINLIDEGPKAVLDHIEFKTLARNSPETVRDFLKIKPGDPIDLNRLYELQNQLFESGRFMQHTMSIKRIPNDERRVVLLINIKEANKVPLLDEPLSDIDQILLRFRQWFLSAGENGEDIVFMDHDSDKEVKCIWGGSRGAMFDLDYRAKQFAELLGNDRHIRFLMDTNSAGFYLPLAGIKLEYQLDASLMNANLSYGPKDDPDAKNLWNLGFGWTIGALDHSLHSGATGINVKRWFAPVAALAKPRESNCSCQLEGPILKIKNDQFTMRIDSATGRLIDGSTFPHPDKSTCQWSVERGAFAAAIQQSQHMPAMSNLASADKPIASLLKFCAIAYCHSGYLAPHATLAQRQLFVRIANQIFNPNKLGDLDRLVNGTSAIFPGEDDFVFPYDPQITRPQQFYVAASKYGLAVNSRLFSNGSWPWTVGRCSCFALLNLTDTINPELQRIYASSDTGPLACMVVADLVKPLDASISQSFARLGVTKLSADGFVKDCQAALSQPHGCSAHVR